MYKEYKLSNGIKVLTRQMASVRSFAFGVYFNACSNYEEGYTLGISHLIEHMMFKGTSKHTAKEIVQSIDNIGGLINAYTSKDCTAYYSKVLYQDAEIPIKLIADMLKNSLMADSAIIKEIEVVKEEIAQYDDSPEDVCYDIFQKQVYDGHVLAEPVLGYDYTVDKIRSEEIRKYMQDFYTAENMVIACAGYLPDNLLELLEEEFGSFRTNGRKVDLPPASFKSAYCFAHKDIEQRHLCLGFDGIKYSDQRYYAMLLLSNVLGGTASSILYQKVREENSLCYSIYSHPTSFIASGHFTIYTSYQAQNQKAVTTLIAESIKQLKSDFDEDTLARAKRQLRGAYLLGLDNSMGQMTMLGKRAIYGGEILTMDEIIERIDSIELATVKGLIDEMFTDKLALAIVGRVDEKEVKSIYQEFKRLLA